MSTIDELERKVERLEQDILRQQELTKEVLAKSEKSVDLAMHAYRIDHAGYVWVWDTEREQYRKTDVCVRVIVPKVKPKEIINTKIADKAVDNRTLDDDAVGNRNLRKNAVNSDNIIARAIESGHIKLAAIINELIGDDAVWTRNIKDRNVTGKKIAKNAINSEHLSMNCVNPNNLSLDFLSKMVLPYTDEIDSKFTDITKELYSMIASLQVGGIALSNQFGDREDIGISQKTLTKAFGRFWQEMETITGRTYMDFTLTVVPVTTYSEEAEVVNITADCSQSISNFDSIGIYVDDELIAESNDVERFTTSATISQTSVVKAVGVILGKTITKQATAIKEIPFFIGSGQVYSDVMNEDCRQQLEGTLEGDYDMTVSHQGDHIFIIIPASRKNEFRRADMNDIEIPFEAPVEIDNIVVYKSMNIYQAGTYNIDININS